MTFSMSTETGSGRPVLRKSIVWCLLPAAAAVLLLLPAIGFAAGMENGIFSGRVLDVSGNPVAGAKVYVYADSNVRQPADYISPPSDRAGEFRLTLPPGRYWIVARVRQGEERFGPLLPGDRPSGAPLVIDLLPGEHLEEEFTVADLRETSKLTVKFDTSFIRVQGTLVNGSGRPLEQAYAYANRQQGFREIPDYVSAWADSNGRVTLFLPPGTYYFGLAEEFPPRPVQSGRQQQVVIDKGAETVDIVLEK